MQCTWIFSQLFGFTNRQITGSIPASIGRLTKLKQLTFRSCSLEGSIPEEMWRLTQLTGLSAKTEASSSQKTLRQMLKCPPGRSEAQSTA